MGGPPFSCHSKVIFENVVKPMILAKNCVNVYTTIVWHRFANTLIQPEPLQSENCLGNKQKRTCKCQCTAPPRTWVPNSGEQSMAQSNPMWNSWWYQSLKVGGPGPPLMDWQLYFGALLPWRTVHVARLSSFIVFNVLSIALHNIQVLPGPAFGGTKFLVYIYYYIYIYRKYKFK